MAEESVDCKPPQLILERLKDEIIRVFDEIEHHLASRRKLLLDRLEKIRRDYIKNLEISEAIEELSDLREGFRSNLVVSSFHENFTDRILCFENSKFDTENFEAFGFRYDSERLRKVINEVDLYEISLEYTGREDPVLDACYRGDRDGELQAPKGVAMDAARNEIYVCDYGNSRIQALSTVGVYIRQFVSNHMVQPHAICMSEHDELFVTDVASQTVLKFTHRGDFLKKAGSRGGEVEQFTGIAGLCCDPGLVFICDCIIDRIQIFDNELNFIKEFGHTELSRPTDIKILAETIYILSQNNNCIYCYDMYCTLQKNIALTGHEHLIIDAYFFTFDRYGNFLITDAALQEILIFSSKGVLRHIMYTKPLPNGIVVDNFDKVITVCQSKLCFQKY